MPAQTITLDWEVKNSANRREHWAVAHRRNKAERELGIIAARQVSVTLPVRICLERVVRGRQKFMDHEDGLTVAFKHLRDGIASELLPHTQGNQHMTWADDSDPRIRWEYQQTRSNRAAIRVTFFWGDRYEPTPAEPEKCRTLSSLVATQQPE